MTSKQPEIRFKGFGGDWEEKKLGEVATFFSGGTPSISKPIYYGGDIPFIRSGEINSNKTELFLTAEGLKNSSAKLVKIGDILYALYGATSGEVSISQINGAINQAILAIKPTKRYMSKFIMQLLKSQKQKIVDKYLQGGQGNLSGSIIKDISIQFPCKEEQQKIGHFFSQLDESIALQQRKIEALKEQKKGFLQKMFPKEGTTVPEVRFEGFSGEWEEKKLGDYVVDYIKKTTKQNQYPVLTSSQQKGIVLQEEYFSNRQITTDNNIGYYILPRGYFTFRSRSDNDVFVFNRNDNIDKGIISYFYPVFNLKNADSDFFLRRINNGIQPQIRIQAEGTGQHVLSIKKFKQIQAMFPERFEQQKIGTFFKQLDDMIALNERELELLKETKKGFLQKLFV